MSVFFKDVCFYILESLTVDGRFNNPVNIVTLRWDGSRNGPSQAGTPREEDRTAGVGLTLPKFPQVIVTLLVTLDRCSQGVMFMGRHGRRGSTPGLLEG